jgi:hypothetical protein
MAFSMWSRDAASELSISPTFYEQLLRQHSFDKKLQKMLPYKKYASKMLAKLTPEHVVEDHVLEVLEVGPLLGCHPFQATNKVSKSIEFVRVAFFFGAKTDLEHQNILNK